MSSSKGRMKSPEKNKNSKIYIIKTAKYINKLLLVRSINIIKGDFHG